MNAGPKRGTPPYEWTPGETFKSCILLTSSSKHSCVPRKGEVLCQVGMSLLKCSRKKTLCLRRTPLLKLHLPMASHQQTQRSREPHMETNRTEKADLPGLGKNLNLRLQSRRSADTQDALLLSKIWAFLLMTKVALAPAPKHLETK